VFRDTVTWSAGASGSQAFWLALQSSPSSGQLLVQLQQPQGAVLDRDAMSTVVEVQSPIIGFKTDLVRAAAYATASLARPRTRNGGCKICASVSNAAHIVHQQHSCGDQSNSLALAHYHEALAAVL
jgi:hypothetical protein